MGVGAGRRHDLRERHAGGLWSRSLVDGGWRHLRLLRRRRRVLGHRDVHCESAGRGQPRRHLHRGEARDRRRRLDRRSHGGPAARHCELRVRAVLHRRSSRRHDDDGVPERPDDPSHRCHQHAGVRRRARRTHFQPRRRCGSPARAPVATARRSTFIASRTRGRAPASTSSRIRRRSSRSSRTTTSCSPRGRSRFHRAARIATTTFTSAFDAVATAHPTSRIALMTWDNDATVAAYFGYTTPLAPVQDDLITNHFDLAEHARVRGDRHEPHDVRSAHHGHVARRAPVRLGHAVVGRRRGVVDGAALAPMPFSQRRP